MPWYLNVACRCLMPAINAEQLLSSDLLSIQLIPFSCILCICLHAQAMTTLINADVAVRGPIGFSEERPGVYLQGHRMSAYPASQLQYEAGYCLLLLGERTANAELNQTSGDRSLG